jgi:hypothetical protein
MSEELDKLFELLGQEDKRAKPKGKGGGWQGSQNSIDALHAHRADIRDRRKCSRCRDIAVNGSQYCRKHGGGIVLSRQGRLSKERMVNGRLRRAENAGAVPSELMAMPVYRAARAQTWKASLLASEMLVAFLAREDDPAAWLRVMDKAREAGLT